MSFTSVDRVAATLTGADESRSRAVQLLQWWQQANASNAYENRFRLVRTFNDPDTSYGFTGVAPIGGQPVAVMGEVEEMFFDQPKGRDIAKFRRELREFVLRYLLRVSDFRQPAVHISENRTRPKGWLRRFSICPDDYVARRGFGYSQWYYKRKSNGEFGRFTDEERFAITDVREVGAVQEWIMLRVKIFDFSFTFKPLGQRLPQVRVPLDESSLLVLSPEFIVDKTGLEVLPTGERVIGQYGFGYAFVRNPTEGLLGYGPGEFDVAFQQIHFRVLENGQTRVQLVFVANRPNKIVNVPLVPLDLGFEMANAATFGLAASVLQPLSRAVNRLPLPRFDPVTGMVDFVNLATAGQAARQLCISRERLEQVFLVRHFKQHYGMITGALLTWREIADWTNEASLPEWVKSGISS